MYRIVKNIKIEDEPIVITTGSEKNAVKKIEPEYDKPFGEIDFTGNLRKNLDATIKNVHDCLNSIMNKIERLVQNHRNSMETSQKQSYERGRVEGISNEGKQILENLQTYIKTVTEKQKQFFSSGEDEVVDLAVKIAENVTRAKIEVDKSVVKNVVKQCLEHIGRSKNIIIRVSSEDYDIIKQQQPEWVDMFESIENIQIVADNAIKNGGCIVETTAGFIDGRISEQLESLKRKLKDGVLKN